jgi:hypothetical protein
MSHRLSTRDATLDFEIKCPTHLPTHVSQPTVDFFLNRVIPVLELTVTYTHRASGSCMQHRRFKGRDLPTKNEEEKADDDMAHALTDSVLTNAQETNSGKISSKWRMPSRTAS